MLPLQKSIMNAHILLSFRIKAVCIFFGATFVEKESEESEKNIYLLSRKDITEHLERVGHFDPVTRTKLTQVNDWQVVKVVS